MNLACSTQARGIRTVSICRHGGKAEQSIHIFSPWSFPLASTTQTSHFVDINTKYIAFSGSVVLVLLAIVDNPG
jgi:hypothetical protein